MKSGKTVIEVSIETRENLKLLGHKGDSYDTIIRRLVDEGLSKMQGLNEQKQ